MSNSTADSVQLCTRPLFGGAISLDLPSDYLDASDLRQIPDNQEVFLSSGSDTTVILEVLGMVEDDGAQNDLWKAAQFHFSSIAHDNASLSSTILTPGPSSPIPSNPSPFPSSTTTPTPTPLPVILAGTQLVHKFSHDLSGRPRPGKEDSSPDNVWVGMALWRIWLESNPQPIGHSDIAVEVRRKKADLVLSVNVNLSAEGADEERKFVEGWFPKLCASLNIEDYNLFGDE